MFGHASFRAGGLFPCGSHVFKYGELTARGSAGGLKGEAVQPVGPFWARKSPALERRNIARKWLRLVRDIGG